MLVFQLSLLAFQLSLLTLKLDILLYELMFLLFDRLLHLVDHILHRVAVKDLQFFRKHTHHPLRVVAGRVKIPVQILKPGILVQQLQDPVRIIGTEEHQPCVHLVFYGIILMDFEVDVKVDEDIW